MPYSHQFAMPFAYMASFLCLATGGGCSQDYPTSIEEAVAKEPQLQMLHSDQHTSKLDTDRVRRHHRFTTSPWKTLITNPVHSEISKERSS